jgi:hypothetical protein
MVTGSIGEEIELLDEEGNVIAGETISVAEEVKEETPAEDKKDSKEKGESKKDEKKAPTENNIEDSISIHTIDLPARAPKKMLMDIKKILETYPGKEKVQLRIGEQEIPLPLTINMSTVLEKKLEDVLTLYETT